MPVPITALAFRPDGQELAASGYREITIWNPANGAMLRRIKNVPQRTLGLAYSPDGNLLAAAGGLPGQSGDVTLYNPADGAIVRQLGSMSDVAWGVAFNPAGNKLAACGADRTIRIYDVASGKEERLIEDHADWVMAVAWNHDGTRLASASRDKTAKLFDAATGESLLTYPGHGEQVFGVAFNADSSQVLSTGKDKKIHVWKSADAAKVGEIGGFGQEVYDITIQGGQVYCCSADKTARQFEAGERKHVRNYEGHADWVYSLTYNDSTKRLATGSFDGEVRVWNAADGALVTSFKAALGLALTAGQACRSASCGREVSVCSAASRSDSTLRRNLAKSSGKRSRFLIARCGSPDGMAFSSGGFIPGDFLVNWLHELPRRRNGLKKHALDSIFIFRSCVLAKLDEDRKPLRPRFTSFCCHSFPASFSRDAASL